MSIVYKAKVSISLQKKMRTFIEKNMFRVSFADENPEKDLAKAIYLHKFLLNKKKTGYCTAKILRKKIVDIRNGSNL